MWNRVALLAAGVAFGWTLVNYWAVGAQQVRTQLARLALALFVGALVIALLAVTSVQAAVAGAFVFLLSALVAYAANAKQVSKVEEDIPFITPERPLEADSRVGVLLVSEGEPLEYDGPGPWARRFKRREARGEPVPHWFVRPLSYARIRRAYEAMGGHHPFAARLAQMAERLQEQLGEGYLVQNVYLDASPRLAPRLYRLVLDGMTQVTLVPISLGARLPEVRDHVTYTRVREIGIQVQQAAALDLALWSAEACEARFDRLIRGEPLVTPTTWDEQALDALHERVVV